MICYLAAPYSHESERIKEYRMHQFYVYDAFLSRQGIFTVSPLYKVETTKHGKMPDDWEYWKEYSYTLLSMCNKMVVMMMHGWETSTGVKAEIEYCEKHGIEVEYVEIGDVYD